MDDDTIVWICGIGGFVIIVAWWFFMRAQMLREIDTLTYRNKRAEWSFYNTKNGRYKLGLSRSQHWAYRIYNSVMGWIRGDDSDDSATDN
jgi:hypothetical protein